MEKTTFADRRDAGRRLAQRLLKYQDAENTVVIGLPRGGVVVGAEVAHRLHLPLDVCIVRKLGVPFQPELAMGAIAMGGVVVLHDYLIRDLGISQVDIDRTVEVESRELDRRVSAYRGDHPRLDLQGMNVILVDDGIATGATMEVAMRVMRASGAKRVVVAVGVAPPAALDRLSHVADEVVTVLRPVALSSIGEWFDDFLQTGDEEVKRRLQRGATGPAR